MTDRIELAGLNVARELTGVHRGRGAARHRHRRGGVLAVFSAIVHDLAPKNRALLAKREALQDEIDRWHRDNGAPSDLEAYKNFLQEIGYLVAGRPGLPGDDRRTSIPRSRRSPARSSSFR